MRKPRFLWLRAVELAGQTGVDQLEIEHGELWRIGGCLRTHQQQSRETYQRSHDRDSACGVATTKCGVASPAKSVMLQERQFFTDGQAGENVRRKHDPMVARPDRPVSGSSASA